ncbi:hypothetical protein ACRTAL_003224 [Clostridium perfringens]|uniref:hypothetical protein n=1 Tax=Clostridium perfringens TaxID=1502 RepID=UPI001C86CF97|nr:hypothetical protein [Clostridium perfringens]EJT6498259.1 hypothetical protein [Clostridium perfringens]MDM0811977.1 hypothetical protein [Clostridium perfringens]
MKKSDLRDGMVVKTRGLNLLVVAGESIVGKRLSIKLEDYDDDLLLKSTYRFNDIMKVYKAGKGFTSIYDFFRTKHLIEVWKRESKIDWNKIPKWTKVQVVKPKDNEENEILNFYFFEYVSEKTKYHYIVKKFIDDEFTGAKDTAIPFDNCSIHPSVKVLEEWYK